MARCNFTVGQHVTLIRDLPWRRVLTGTINLVGPKFGEICTVSCVQINHDDIYICFIEFPTERGGYLASAFKPVLSTETGMSILRSLLKTRELEHVR
jgi:hypothetical protein